MDPTPAPEGSPAWALAQLRAGKRIRKSIWGLGHVRLEGERLIVCMGDDTHHEVSIDFLSVDCVGWRWELDSLRRFAFSGATRADLAMLPPAVPIGLAIQAIDRCTAGDRDFSALVLSAWTAVGEPDTGRRLIDWANTPEGYMAFLAARAGHDSGALPHLLKLIESVKGAR